MLVGCMDVASSHLGFLLFSKYVLFSVHGARHVGLPVLTVLTDIAPSIKCVRGLC